MTSVLLELVRHKTWATQKLFALCESIDPLLVDAPAPGTYGTVRATLVHMVNGDGLFFDGLKNSFKKKGQSELKVSEFSLSVSRS